MDRITEGEQEGESGERPGPREHKTLLAALAAGGCTANPAPANLVKGRCYRCGVVWLWYGAAGRKTAGSRMCLDCGQGLSATTELANPKGWRWLAEWMAARSESREAGKRGAGSGERKARVPA